MFQMTDFTFCLLTLEALCLCHLCTSSVHIFPTLWPHAGPAHSCWRQARLLLPLVRSHSCCDVFLLVAAIAKPLWWHLSLHLWGCMPRPARERATRNYLVFKIEPPQSRWKDFLGRWSIHEIFMFPLSRRHSCHSDEVFGVFSAFPLIALPA